MKSTITAIIQARVNSTRLPRKVLLPLNGKTVLEQVVERTKKAKSLRNVIVATSKKPSDDDIETLCKKRRIDCFRGNLDDVLDRYYQCAKIYGVKNIARITGDCPLIDTGLLNRAAKIYVKGNFDYVSTAYPTPTFPDGLDVEIFSFQTLEKSWQEAKFPSEREHVTPYIWKHPELFRIHTIKNKVDLSSHRWTLDEPQDYEFLKIIFDRVKPLTTNAILKFLKEHPETQHINQAIQRNKGYEKSLTDEVRKVLPEGQVLKRQR